MDRKTVVCAYEELGLVLAPLVHSGHMGDSSFRPPNTLLPISQEGLVQPHAESVERRLLEERWRLRHPPVHRRPERFERAVHRCQLHVFGVIRFGLEAIDVVRLLQRIERQLAEVLLEHGDAAAD